MGNAGHLHDLDRPGSPGDSGRSVLLPGSEPAGPPSGGAVFFQTVAVISLLTQIGIALLRFGCGDPSGIKWMTLTASAITFAAILPAWKLLKHFNAVAGEIMRQSIRPKSDDAGAKESGQAIGANEPISGD